MISLIKKLGEGFLDYCLRFKCFQDYVNGRYNVDGFNNKDNYVKNLLERDGLQIMPEWILSNSIYFYNGFKFRVDDQLHHIKCIELDYALHEIKLNPEDVVLNLGANIGLIPILKSRECRKIYAVEPLYCDILKINIALNDINNIVVFEFGVGDKDFECSYDRRVRFVKCKTLGEILKEIPEKPNVLFLNCEGGEHSIKGHELKDIQRIIGMVHLFKSTENKKESFLRMLDGAGFEYTIKPMHDDVGLGFMIDARRCRGVGV